MRRIELSDMRHGQLLSLLKKLRLSAMAAAKRGQSSDTVAVYLLDALIDDVGRAETY